VDREQLARHQASCSLIDAEECLKAAFSSDVRPVVEEWRRARGIAPNPLRAFRESGYLRRAVEARAGHAQPLASYA
jgi:L-rhamnose isomerase/sugar isomerase